MFTPSRTNVGAFFGAFTFFCYKKILYINVLESGFGSSSGTSWLIGVVRHRSDFPKKTQEKIGFSLRSGSLRFAACRPSSGYFEVRSEPLG